MRLPYKESTQSAIKQWQLLTNLKEPKNPSVFRIIRRQMKVDWNVKCFLKSLLHNVYINKEEDYLEWVMFFKK